MIMNKRACIETGVRNLDDLFVHGVPRGSTIMVTGAPGAGKTILAQQMGFYHASPAQPVLYFNTLSEPTAKMLYHLSQFSFFDPKKIDHGMLFVDLGTILRSEGVAEASKCIMDRVKATKPFLVIIDSFKIFDDLAQSRLELRKFGYELAVTLMAWEATTLLLGEYGAQEIATNPLFSIVDGMIVLMQHEQSGEQQRFCQIVKMRGTDHSRDAHPFVITSHGMEVFAPRLTIQREDRGPGHDRCRTGISKLDDLLGAGIPRGSSVLVAGVAGTGKTVLLLEFLYRGALAGERGVIFSFEETAERLRATAHGLGWNLDREIERGMIEIVFIPLPNVMVEAHLLMMRERVEKMGARRVALDSVSVFLYKINDPRVAREKVFQLASIIQNTQAVGFFAADIPYGSRQLSRFGVEETVVDGVILLSLAEEELERERYLEVYKLRNTAHLKGRHTMTVGLGGITVFPRYCAAEPLEQPPPPVETSRRLPSGVPGLDALLGGGLLERSVTLVSGSAGVGKTTLALQFVVEGARHEQAGLYVALEEGPGQLFKTAEALGLPLQDATDKGLVETLYLSRDDLRPSQFFAVVDDAMARQRSRRLVLDGLRPIATSGAPPEELPRLLRALSLRLKSRDVTALFTIESDATRSDEPAAQHGYAPIADNLLTLRYAQVQGELRPTLSVVKTRGSANDRSMRYLAITSGGLRVEERVDGGRGSPGDGRRADPYAGTGDEQSPR